MLFPKKLVHFLRHSVVGFGLGNKTWLDSVSLSYGLINISGKPQQLIILKVYMMSKDKYMQTLEWRRQWRPVDGGQDMC